MFFVGTSQEGCTAVTVEFRPDNVIIMDCLGGFGYYLSVGNVFTGVYWSNNYYLGSGVGMILSGFSVYPYIAAGGFAYYDNRVSPVVMAGYIL